MITKPLYRPRAGFSTPLTIAGARHFTILDATGGGGNPLCVSKLSVVKLSENIADCAGWVMAIGGAFFDPMSKFDPVMRGQKSNLNRQFSKFTSTYLTKLFTVSKRNRHQRVLYSILSKMKCCCALLILILACMAWYRQRRDYNAGVPFGTCLCLSSVSNIKKLHHLITMVEMHRQVFWILK